MRLRGSSACAVCPRQRTDEILQTPVRHQTFDNLSLVPPYEPTITLTSLLSSYTSPEYLDDVVCPNCSRKLTLEKLRLAIDKARKKCEIARKVFEAQESDKDSANHAAPLPGEMAPSKDPNCLRDLLPKVHAMEAVLPPDTIRLLSLPFSTWAETIPSPPHDINPALLRLDVELRRLHDLIHDLATLETVSPDEFLDLGRDKLSIEKVRSSLCLFATYAHSHVAGPAHSGEALSNNKTTHNF